MPDLMALSPFLLLFIAVAGLWVDRRLWAAALAAAVVAGHLTGALSGFAGLWIAILALLAFGFSRARSALPRALLGLAVLGWSLAMALLLLPGFERTLVAGGLVLSPGSVPYDLALGFPKVSAGVLILGLISTQRVRSWSELARVLKHATLPFAVTLIGVMGLCLAVGYVRFEPKWHTLFLVWAPVNLFFTCLAEEAFFRGFVQQELARLGGNPRVAAGLALIVAAVLFGLAHAAGGWMYVAAATLAGLGYGWAYLRTGRIEAAMAVHFGVNLVHILLFTYPRAA